MPNTETRKGFYETASGSGGPQWSTSKYFMARKMLMVKADRDEIAIQNVNCGWNAAPHFVRSANDTVTSLHRYFKLFRLSVTIATAIQKAPQCFKLLSQSYKPVAPRSRNLRPCQALRNSLVSPTEEFHSCSLVIRILWLLE